MTPFETMTTSLLHDRKERHEWKASSDGEGREGRRRRRAKERPRWEILIKWTNFSISYIVETFLLVLQKNMPVVTFLHVGRTVET